MRGKEGLVAVSKNSKTCLTTIINLENYYFEFNHTESSAAETIFYVNNHLSYKGHHDLYIYKANQSEHIFIEIINPLKSNIDIACLCNHQVSMFLILATTLASFFKILSKERKEVFLLDDYNINHSITMTIDQPLIILLHTSYSQLELLVIQKLSLTIYSQILFHIKYMVT